MLRWRLFGINFCIQPSFWIVSALWGFVMLSMSGEARINRHFWLFILIWVLCTLVSVMVHELGHVIMARIFGQAGSITLAGMGGQATGNYPDLSPQKRILVSFAGPGAGFLFLAFAIGVDNFHWNPMIDWLGFPFLKTPWCFIQQYPDIQLNPIFHLSMYFLILMNLIWNLFNLLPIIPMDGGMIMADTAIIISPKGGMTFAHAVSFLLAGMLTVYFAVALWQKYVSRDLLPFLLETFIFPEFGVFSFAMMAFQNFMALRQTLFQRRYEAYYGRDD